MRHQGFRSYDWDYRQWAVDISGNHIRADAGQDAILKDILQGREDVIIKLVEDESFDDITGKRLAFIGTGIVKSVKRKWPNDTQTTEQFVVTGCGPLECRQENETSKDFVCFCEDQITNIYMTHLSAYKPPDAPPGSLGWTIEHEFVPNSSGTGNIGTYQFVGVLPITISGCPVYVSFRYTCVNSPVIPSGVNGAFGDFLEIAEVTLNEDQIATLENIQAAIGMYYPAKTWTEIYYEFNLVFLVDNPDFELDLSGLGMSDLSLLNTFTNLKHVNLNDNEINGFGLQQIDRLSLITIKLHANALGMNDSKFLSPMFSTLKHINLKYNNIQEMYGFSSFSGTLDFLDISENVVASMGWGSSMKVKDFRYNRNVYPSSVPYWLAAKGAASSGTNIAALLWDQSLTENFEIDDTELRNQVADPTTIINKIATDKAISFAAAELLFSNNPTWLQVENTIGHAPYDPTILK